MTSFTVADLPADVCRATADRIVSMAGEAIDERGIFRVALPGGSTPVEVYGFLLEPARRDAIDWRSVEFFWGDERRVPPDHPDSNFGSAYGLLISQLPDVLPQRIHRMPAEAADLDAAAMTYESELRLCFGARGDAPPAFDLMWLGMGPDGHTASLFPGSAALMETERWVVGNWAPSRESWRMTLTFPVLLAARHTIVSVIGANKREALASIRSGASDLPAARVAGDAVEWIVDASAAGARAA